MYIDRSKEVELGRHTHHVCDEGGVGEYGEFTVAPHYSLFINTDLISIRNLDEMYFWHIPSQLPVIFETQPSFLILILLKYRSYDSNIFPPKLWSNCVVSADLNTRLGYNNLLSWPMRSALCGREILLEPR